MDRLHQVDAVAVCSPDLTHVAYVQRALSAGRFVLCEFPLCEGSTTAASMLATGRLHVEHIELLTGTARALRGLRAVRGASMRFTGPPRESFSAGHAQVARLHRVLDCLGSPLGVDQGLVYPGFTCTLSFGEGPRCTEFRVQAGRDWHQLNGRLTCDGVEVDTSGPPLFLTDQLAASARFLDGAVPYVADARVVEVLALAEVLGAALS